MKAVWQGAILISFVAISMDVCAQDVRSSDLILGNEWINEDQDYYKIEVLETGIYRITYAALKEAGVPVDIVPAQQLQMFSYGEEVSIRVSANGMLDSDDFIEFFGKTNDGTIDARLYENPDEQQLNQRFSLYTDKNAYFLTWKETSSEDHLRYRKRPNGLDGPGLPPREDYYLHSVDTVFHDFHFKPTHDGRNYIRYSNMDTGEGFGSELKNISDVSIDLPGFIKNGIDAQISLRFATNILSRSLQVQINEQPFLNTTQAGFGVVNINKAIDAELIDQERIDVRIRGLTGENEKHTISNIGIKYPRKYDFDGKSEFLYYQQPSIISRYVEVENFDISSLSTPILYNLDDHYFIETEVEEGKVKFVTPSTFSTKQLILVSINGVKYVETVEKVNMVVEPAVGDYLILSRTDVLAEGINAYANYRESAEGGGFDVSIIDVAALYNQFGYGLEGHVIAVTNYFDYLTEKNELPKYVLILGKGREYGELRKAGTSVSSLVPTFGVPGSDNLLINSKDGIFPQIPIGRIAATNSEEVLNYLEKIRLHENPEPGDQTIGSQKWKKTIVHLSGGSADIQDILFNYLNSMEEVISYNKFGAEVSTFRKTSADVIQGATSEQIIDKINQGAAMVTFFGHSAVGTFDFSLEDPSKYNNAGRNPIIISLGCHSGNIHTAFPGVSEEFVLEKDMGAIAFIASSGTAFPGPQYNMGRKMYDLLGGEMYGQPLGDIFIQSLRTINDQPTIDIQTLVQQFTFHGDPAYRYHTFKGPDYLIDQNSVVVDPSLLNSSTKKFTLKFDLVNIGATIEDLINVQVVHIMPNGQPRDTVDVLLPTPAFRSPIEIEFENPGFEGVGLNKITIKVDPKDEIVEFPIGEAEMNNELTNSFGEPGYRFFILDNSAKPVFPPEFSIITEDEPVTLTCAINNALSPGGIFTMQIDTTESFDSPIVKSSEILNTSSLIKWTPDINYEDGRVYYWRISPIVNEGENLKNNAWRTSSFLYNPGSAKGWNQSHYYQWLKNGLYKLDIDSETRNLSFSERSWDIRIKNEITDPSDFWVFVNSTPWASLNPKNLAPGIAIFIWDQNNVIFQNSGTDFGSIPFSQDGFVYRMDKTEDRQNIKTLLDSVPAGSRVFLHTILNNENADLHIEDWVDDKEEIGYDFFEVLESHGARRIRELIDKGTVPYTFIFDKGKGAVIEDVASTILESLDISATGKTIWEDGKMTSVEIGPVNRWMRLLWSEEKNNFDKTAVMVYGVKTGGQRALLKEIVDDYSVNLTSIDPSEFPKIQLEYVTSDKTTKSSAQIDFWKVLGTELPDVALFSDKAEFPIPDTLNSGQDLDLTFEVVNLTESDIEPILVRYRLIDEKNHSTVFVKRAQGIEGKASVLMNESLPTDGMGGMYRLEIEINPNMEQRELTDCNNFGFTDVFIREDKRNPILDVTFDGRHIKDGELISESPEIIITLYDENPYVLIDNPDDFEIKLYYPDVLAWQIDEMDDGVEFFPAQNPSQNLARFVINPYLNAKGIYTLEVQARDPAGNKSGENPYRVKFEVGDIDLEQPFKIYPNPLQDYADIEYFLRGDRSPEVFVLNIYTINGIKVKSIYKSHFGGILPGINRYRWDGRDEAGNLLINGLYYYELVNSVDLKKEKKKGSILIMR